MKTLILFLALAFAVCPPPADGQENEHFRITRHVMNAGGSPGSSPQFRLLGSVGEIVPVRDQSCEGFWLSAGFLGPSFVTSALSPIQHLVICRVGLTLDVRLNWEKVPDASWYRIHRSTDPLAAPSSADSIGMATDTTFDDVGAILLTPALYFYSVIASNSPVPVLVTVKPAPQTPSTGIQNHPRSLPPKRPAPTSRDR